MHSVTPGLNWPEKLRGGDNMEVAADTRTWIVTTITNLEAKR